MNNDVKRFGLLVPPRNVAMERELPLYLGENVVMNVNRLSRPTTAVTEASLLAMLGSVDQAARDLAMCYPQPGVIVFGCTSGSFVSGVDKDKEISDRITELVGIPAVTTSSALLDSLRFLDARRVFLLTPYTADITAKAIEMMSHNGFMVPYSDSFGCVDAKEIARLSSDVVRERILRKKALVAECDAVFISCTQLLTMDAINDMEAELEVPVVSSNQCSLWAALRVLGEPANTKAPGVLLRSL